MKREVQLAPITPKMADDWREHIMPVLPDNLAIGFTALAAKVYEQLEARSLNPRGSVADAVMAMAAEGELAFTTGGNIQSTFTNTQAI